MTEKKIEKHYNLSRAEWALATKAGGCKQKNLLNFFFYIYLDYKFLKSVLSKVSKMSNMNDIIGTVIDISGNIVIKAELSV